MDRSAEYDDWTDQTIRRDWGYRDRDDRDQERMDREDAMVANYDPADHARGVDEPQSDGDEDARVYRVCRVCHFLVGDDGYLHMRSRQNDPAHAVALASTSWQSLISEPDDVAPLDCRICGEPVQFSQGRLRHAVPATPTLIGAVGSFAYDAGQFLYGKRLAEFTLRTADHEAAL